VSSRTPFGIDDQLAEEGVGDLALERANSFALGLALGDLAIEVCPAIGVGLPDLRNRCDVDGVIELAITTAREPAGDPST
jgi:hypothetical protein